MRVMILLFLLSFDAVFLFTIIVFGQITAEALVIRLVMAVPIMVGNILGARVFNPDRGGLFPKVAFCIIAISEIQDLLLFD